MIQCPCSRRAIGKLCSRGAIGKKIWMTRSFLCISRGDFDIHKSKHYEYQNKFPMQCKTCLVYMWVLQEEP